MNQRKRGRIYLRIYLFFGQAKDASPLVAIQLTLLADSLIVGERKDFSQRFIFTAKSETQQPKNREQPPIFKVLFVLHQDQTYLQVWRGAACLFLGTGLAFSTQVVKISGKRARHTSCDAADPNAGMHNPCNNKP